MLFKAYGPDYRQAKIKTQRILSNNILDGSTYSLFVIASTAGTLPELDSNAYIQYEENNLTLNVKFAGCKNYLKELDPNAEIRIKPINEQR